MATFTGTLLKRERHPAKHLVQLVFRENGKNWLCLSSNLANARLDIGQNYRIEGICKKMGERPFIHEPSISVVKQRSIALVVGICVAVGIVVAGATAAALSALGGPVQPQSSNAKSSTPAKSTPSTTQTKSIETSTPVVPPATAPSATAVTPPSRKTVTPALPKSAASVPATYQSVATQSIAPVAEPVGVTAPTGTVDPSTPADPATTDPLTENGNVL